MLKFKILLVALGWFVLAVGTVHAEAITIANPGIEVAGAGGNTTAQNWWQTDDNFRYGVLGGLSPHGGDWLGFLGTPSHSAGQVLPLKVGGETLHMSVGDQITIDFYHGVRSDGNFNRSPAKLTIKLRADTAQTGTLLASQVYTDPDTGGVWEARSFTYTATVDAAGKDLYFELQNDRPGSATYRQVAMDDFSGSYTPIPEPGTLALLATGLIGLLCYAWRRRK